MRWQTWRSSITDTLLQIAIPAECQPMSNDPPPPDSSAPSSPQRKRRWWLWLLIPLLVFLLLIPVSLLLVGFIASTGVGTDAKIGQARADLKTLQMNIARYRTNMGRQLPATLRDLSIKPADSKGPWRKMMEESFLKDPWGNDYRYRNPGTHNPTGYDIFSIGPDGQEGTADDIGNWSN